ncbi:hypothetical protein [Ensifer sp. SSB1]|jgi:hypothetical protein|uniref:hypothetical protein n=1 Tax=Ensifer sp. SSB1 TaxID=2795385 RepID=UPI000DE2E1DA|nr:hypothetical protein [Ensifer sp. SSB1]MBK5571227.1 hypothetical protein [Ensifer sp. SSB1]
MSLSVVSAAALSPPYSAEDLVRMDRFREGLDSAARELLETHLALPREVHYVADLRRWMLSQMTMAMHFEHRQDRTCLPISPGNLARTMSAIASRNTVHAFLFEMRRYGFVEPLESADGRQRAVRATEMSEQLIRRYFDIHLRALDIIDGGGRFALSRQQPDLLHRAQPRFARLLLARRDWHKPPPSIAKFVRSDSGSSVLHDLIKNVPSLPTDSAAPVWIGKVSPNALSSRYRISRTHTARLFGLAREAGLIGWAKKSNRGACWISSALVHDYRYWQAIKLSAVATAFAEACLTSGALKAA